MKKQRRPELRFGFAGWHKCGHKGWTEAPVGGSDAPVGGVSFERDRRGSASNEHGGVSFERDRGRIPIVVDGREVLQMVAR